MTKFRNININLTLTTSNLRLRRPIVDIPGLICQRPGQTWRSLLKDVQPRPWRGHRGHGASNMMSKWGYDTAVKHIYIYNYNYIITIIIITIIIITSIIISIIIIMIIIIMIIIIIIIMFMLMFIISLFYCWFCVLTILLSLLIL